MLWALERSDDQVTWKRVATFFWSELAQAAFDAELSFRKAKYVRLLGPDGKVHERACIKKLSKEP